MGNMCANQGLDEVLITLTGMMYKKESLNKMSILEINTYTKTFEKILYFWENIVIFSSMFNS